MSDMTWPDDYVNQIICGDSLEILKDMPDGIVQTVITSPPYWGLRDYGTASWDGGDKDCDHTPRKQISEMDGRQGRLRDKPTNICQCGAIRIDDQLGLEATPELYIEKMVAIFREVRRVMRDDATLWLNLGDSYAGSWGNSGSREGGQRDQNANKLDRKAWDNHTERPASSYSQNGLKPKDLCGIPWRVALALQEPYYTGKIRKQSDRIWLASMIDGEGCMFIHKRKAGQSNGQGYFRKNDSYGAGLEVANTHESIVKRCQEITGMGSICRVERETKFKKRNIPLYRWNMRSNQCRDIVREVYPHLVGKQHEARLLLACPSSGVDAEKAHASLIALHNGKDACIDFPPPKPMFEPGWYLRSDVIWSKKNPMPESCTDRPTKAHEYIFLLTKKANYYYDADAIREKSDEAENIYRNQLRQSKDYNLKDPYKNNFPIPQADGNRNARSVWTIATQPYAEAHFATFPEELARRCILAGSAEQACGVCGAPWERVIDYKANYGKRETAHTPNNEPSKVDSSEWKPPKRDTLGFRPTCEHDNGEGRCIVADFFMGAGTVALVALKGKRDFIGSELNPDYIKMAMKRIEPYLKQEILI